MLFPICSLIRWWEKRQHNLHHWCPFTDYGCKSCCFLALKIVVALLQKCPINRLICCMHIHLLHYYSIKRPFFLVVLLLPSTMINIINNASILNSPWIANVGRLHCWTTGKSALPWLHLSECLSVCAFVTGTPVCRECHKYLSVCPLHYWPVAIAASLWPSWPLFLLFSGDRERVTRMRGHSISLFVLCGLAIQPLPHTRKLYSVVDIVYWLAAAINNLPCQVTLANICCSLTKFI